MEKEANQKVLLQMHPMLLHLGEIFPERDKLYLNYLTKNFEIFQISVFVMGFGREGNYELIQFIYFYIE